MAERFERLGMSRLIAEKIARGPELPGLGKIEPAKLRGRFHLMPLVESDRFKAGRNLTTVLGGFAKSPTLF